MLQLAGVDMDHHPPGGWLGHAHTAVRFVSGSNPAQGGPPPPWPPSSDPRVRSALGGAAACRAPCLPRAPGIPLPAPPFHDHRPLHHHGVGGGQWRAGTPPLSCPGGVIPRVILQTLNMGLPESCRAMSI